MTSYARRIACVIGSAVCVAAAALPSEVAVAAPAAPAAPAAGSSWHVSALVSLHRFRNLLGLTATGPHDAWAFGDGPRHPVAVHWNGKTWTGVVLPGANARPEQVSATSRTNVWASGHRCFGGPPEPPGTSAYVDRWNGSRWATSKFKSATFCAGAVVTTGPKDGWLFGSTIPATALHFTGRSWRSIPLGVKGQVVTASGVSASDVWAVTSNAAAVRWNGSSWRRVRLPNLHLAKGESFLPMASLAVSPADIWLSGVILHKHLPVLLNWTGKGWRRIAVPGRISLNSITADGRGGLWMIGLTTSGTYDFAHYTHGTVTTQPIPIAGLPGAKAGEVTFDIYAIAGIPGTESAWATGDAFYGTHSYTVIFKFGP